MRDRNGKDIYVGDLLSIVNHPEIVLQCNWIYLDSIDLGLTIDLVLQNATTKEIRFINFMDVQRQF